jgi:hypothetical protein
MVASKRGAGPTPSTRRDDANIPRENIILSGLLVLPFVVFASFWLSSFSDSLVLIVGANVVNQNSVGNDEYLEKNTFIDLCNAGNLFSKKESQLEYTFSNATRILEKALVDVAVPEAL